MKVSFYAIWCFLNWRETGTSKMYRWRMHLRSNKRLRIRSQGEREEVLSLWFHFLTGFCKRLSKHCCWPHLTTAHHYVFSLNGDYLLAFHISKENLPFQFHSSSIKVAEILCFICIVNNPIIIWKQSFQWVIKDPLLLSPWYDSTDILYYISHAQIPY